MMLIHLPAAAAAAAAAADKQRWPKGRVGKRANYAILLFFWFLETLAF
jgi:hypothetical protein